VRATEPQSEYLSILFIDCGYTLPQRKAFLKKRFGREIVFVDDLTKAEASQVIAELKDQKERQWSPE
jgi:hypothetical protein